MPEPYLPSHLVEGRRTPLFDSESLPAALAKAHRTTVWAVVHVEAGSVRFVDLEGPSPRDVRLEAGDRAVIVPGVEHYVEPSTDATFFVQFHRESDATQTPTEVEPGPSQHPAHDTVDGGWSGPNATTAKKRATGAAWVMAKRFLGKGAWNSAHGDL